MSSALLFFFNFSSFSLGATLEPFFVRPFAAHHRTGRVDDLDPESLQRAMAGVSASHQVRGTDHRAGRAPPSCGG